MHLSVNICLPLSYQIWLSTCVNVVAILQCAMCHAPEVATQAWMSSYWINSCIDKSGHAPSRATVQSHKNQSNQSTGTPAVLLPPALLPGKLLWRCRLERCQWSKSIVFQRSVGHLLIIVEYNIQRTLSALQRLVDGEQLRSSHHI